MASTNANPAGGDGGARQELRSGKNTAIHSLLRFTPQWLSVYAGQRCIGHVLHRGKSGFEGFDADDNPIGTWPTVQQAADAVAERVSAP